MHKNEEVCRKEHIQQARFLSDYTSGFPDCAVCCGFPDTTMRLWCNPSVFPRCSTGEEVTIEQRVT